MSSPKTPAEAQVEKILKQLFPSIETFEPRGRDHLDFPEVYVEDLKRAVAMAFAAGRDFEGVRRDRRAARDEAKVITHHCSKCNEQVFGADVCSAHPNAKIDSIAGAR